MNTSEKSEERDTTAFTAHHLRFEVEMLTPLLLPAYAGSSIRGALFSALRHHFCPVPDDEVPSSEHKAVCPVCWLMATEKPQNNRGRDVPRPYTVEPPTPTDGASQWFAPGERFTFGLTVFAKAMNLFPYLVMATPLMGQAGLGVPLQENGSGRQEKKRGRFTLRRIEAVNPLTGEVVPVMGEGQTRVQLPDNPATNEDVWSLARAMMGPTKSRQRVWIQFRTPMRIVEGGRLVQQPWLGPIFRRLLERLDALRSEFAGDPPVSGRERLVSLLQRFQQYAVGRVESHHRPGSDHRPVSGIWCRTG